MNIAVSETSGWLDNYLIIFNNKANAILTEEKLALHQILTPVIPWWPESNQWRNGVLGFEWFLTTQWPSFPRLVGYKQEPIPVEKLHDSQLSNHWSFRTKLGLWPHGSWTPMVVSLLGIMWFLNRQGFLLYSLWNQCPSVHSVTLHQITFVTVP